jgi:acyl-coenzyme A synthetase/AMP-(fatty) acid ligase
MGDAYFPGGTRNLLTIYGASIWFVYISCTIVLRKGGSIIFSSLDRFLEDVNIHPKCHSAMLMKDIHHLQKIFPQGQGNQKLATLRVLGSNLPMNVRIWLENYLAEKVFNTYSSNESGQIGETLPNGQYQVYPDVQVRIIDEHWNDLPQGELGLITIQSPRQVSGYLWNLELNIEHFKEGWFRSNDIGYLTPEGNLILVDRADNMLNLAGIKVPPAPIEAQIKLFPGVDDCVLLEEDTLSDLQTIVICIETSQFVDRPSLEKSIIAIVTKRFKSYRFYYPKAFPRTETGKVRRKELQQQIIDALKMKLSER